MEEIHREKLRIWKNLGFLSLSYTCLFTAIDLVFNLQSTINRDDGMGTISQAMVYVAQIFSSMFVSTLMMKKLNLKWAMVVSQLCYSVYIVAQFYPSFATLIPSAVILGISAAPLWSAKASYLTQLGVRHSALLTGKNDSAESSISRFFGIFFMVFSFSSIFGNLIGSFVLSAGKEEASATLAGGQQCGVDFCYSNEPDKRSANVTDDITQLNNQNIPMLMGILLGFALFATLILAVLVDPPPADEASSGGVGKKYVWRMMMATFKQMKDPNQLLLVPMTLWSGFDMTFWSADFTYAFIACSLGLEKLCFIMLCMGVVSAFGSIACGYLVKVVGRIPLFLFGSLTNFALLVAMQFFWVPDPSKPEIFFIVAALNGITNAVWGTLINTLYAVLFTANKEAAFSNYRLWQSIGFTVGLSYATFLCVRVKLYILMTIFLVSVAGYLGVEIRERHKSKMDGK